MRLWRCREGQWVVQSHSRDVEELKFKHRTLEPAFLTPIIYRLYHRAETPKEENGEGDNAMHSYWGFWQALSGHGRGYRGEPGHASRRSLVCKKGWGKDNKARHQKVEQGKCRDRSTDQCGRGIKGGNSSFFISRSSLEETVSGSNSFRLQCMPEAGKQQEERWKEGLGPCFRGHSPVPALHSKPARPHTEQELSWAPEGEFPGGRVGSAVSWPGILLLPCTFVLLIHVAAPGPAPSVPWRFSSFRILAKHGEKPLSWLLLSSRGMLSLWRTACPNPRVLWVWVSSLNSG